MTTEIEVKFVKVDHDLIRHALILLGAEPKTPKRLMKRAIFFNKFMKTDKDGFLRVRDEGNKVTMTYKQFNSLSVDGAKEIEIEVSDFDDTISLLEETGMKVASVQETKRETWIYNDVLIELDQWPWLDPYIEIEGSSEVKLKDVAHKLGLDWKNAVFGDVMVAYKIQYPHLTNKQTVGNIKEVKFNTPVPDMFITKS